MIKILLADDHVIVRDGVKAVLERKGKDLEVVGEVGNGVLRVSEFPALDLQEAVFV